MSTTLEAKCPACTMTVRVPAESVRIVEADYVDRVRIVCDDCGPVTIGVPFLALIKLVRNGTPPPLLDEDVYDFQEAMVAEGPCLSAVAQREGAGA